jgi:hypothetical protein
MYQSACLFNDVSGTPRSSLATRSEVQAVPLTLSRACMQLAHKGGFLYDADSYSDELPYWVQDCGPRPHLVVPYTLDCNDFRFAMPQGFNSGDQFFT